MQKDSGEKGPNIVLMGTGEPLGQYDNVPKFLAFGELPEGNQHRTAPYLLCQPAELLIE